MISSEEKIIVSLNSMQFKVPLGWYDEEQVLHTEIEVCISYSVMKTNSTQLESMIDYSEVFNLVKSVCQVPHRLIEELATEILNKIFDHFDSMSEAEVMVIKKNPPVEGQMKQVSVKVFHSKLF